MRLLHFDAVTRSPKWTRFTGQVPPYAILSHTWGDDEPTFEDLVTDTAWTKTGYRKILFCGKQAARDGIEYFWVDSCCIDKWDLEKVSSAINSMFHWYQNAEKCYAYLSDVPSPDAGNLDEWEASFRNSRWWKRGWTLQELIAPSSLEFFSSRCQRLGDKKELEQRICDITSIPLNALRGHLDKFSMEERIGWVSQRETTEEEDMIYCLLGICNVNIPAYYGEGKETAMWRLQSEIKGQSDKSEADRALFMVPFKRNHQFTGRELQLSSLEKQLFAGTSTAKVTITGTSGVGKTQLATELAYRARQTYPDCSVFWIAATDVTSLYQSYRHIAQRLGLSGWDDRTEDVRTLVKDHLSQASVGQWLLIFDGVETELWTADYLPESSGGTILFTTTSREDAVRLSPSNIVEMPEGDRRVARQMLQALLPGLDLIHEQQYADLMIEKLDALPLAIGLAAAYIRVNHKTVQDYMSLLTDQGDIAVHTPSEGFENEHSRVTNSVTAVCLISLGELERQNRLAADYMSFMACVDSIDIPQALLPEAETYEDHSAAIEALTNYSIVTKRPAGRALDMHRSVHLTAQRWLRMQASSDHWVPKVAARLVEMLPIVCHHSLSKERRLLPHALYITTSKLWKEDDGDQALLALMCAVALRSQGRYTESEKFCVKALDIVTKNLGADDNETHATMDVLAAIYTDQELWDAAELLHLQVLETREKKLGADHPDILTSRNNLAATYWSQGRWDAAENLQLQVLETRKKKLGVDHPDILTSRSNLASIYWSQGRWDAAEQLEVQLMETLKNKLGADHPHTLTGVMNLASTYSSQGRWDAAEPLEVQMLEIYKKTLGADSPATLICMSNLAFTFKARGRGTEAVSLMRDCLKRRQRVLGNDYPDTRASSAALMKWEAESMDVSSEANHVTI